MAEERKIVYEYGNIPPAEFLKKVAVYMLDYAEKKKDVNYRKGIKYVPSQPSTTP